MSFPTFAQYPFSASFLRNYSRDGLDEVQKGHLYFYSKDHYIIEVNEPVNQKMEVKSNEISIYYPDDNKLILISDRSDKYVNDFASYMVNISEYQNNLLSNGFAIINIKQNRDTLITKLLPPKEMRDKITDVLIHSHDNDVVKISIKSNNIVLSEIIFSDYTDIDNIRVPKVILIYNTFNDYVIEDVVNVDDIGNCSKNPDAIMNITGIPEIVDLRR